MALRLALCDWRLLEYLNDDLASYQHLRYLELGVVSLYYSFALQIKGT
jgi:hypothetical protein